MPEATGGFEATVAAALAGAGLPLAVVDPRQVRHFAKAVGRLARTDRLDAEVIALFAERARPEARALPDDAARRLAELVARRRRLVEMITAEDNRRRQARDPRLRRRVEDRLAWPREALAGSDADPGSGPGQALDGAARASPAWREREELPTSAPGVGGVTAGTSPALPPELGALDRRRVASLAGLAPVSRDSGERRGAREIAGGRGPLRAAPYVAALAAPAAATPCPRPRTGACARPASRPSSRSRP